MLGRVAARALPGRRRLRDRYDGRVSHVVHLRHGVEAVRAGAPRRTAPTRSATRSQRTASLAARKRRADHRRSPGADESQALPTVVEIDGRYTCSSAIGSRFDFRTTRTRLSHRPRLVGRPCELEARRRLIHARGHDRATGTRDMQCYPHVFECDGRSTCSTTATSSGAYGFGAGGAGDDERAVEYRVDTAPMRPDRRSPARCDAVFVPPLSGRVDLEDYARKIAEQARALRGLVGSSSVGLVAAYCNDAGTPGGVHHQRQRASGLDGQGIARGCWCKLHRPGRRLGLRTHHLEVDRDNAAASRLYEKLGFTMAEPDRHDQSMTWTWNRSNPMSDKRDYDTEISDTRRSPVRLWLRLRRHAPVHDPVVRAVLRQGAAGTRELQGRFHSRLLPYFDDVTCVEASGEAIVEAHSAGSATRCSSSTRRFEDVDAAASATTTSC